MKADEKQTNLINAVVAMQMQQHLATLLATAFAAVEAAKKKPTTLRKFEAVKALGAKGYRLALANGLLHPQKINPDKANSPLILPYSEVVLAKFALQKQF